MTDANIVLGIIDPDFFLGGSMPLSKVLAEAAVIRVADRLGLGLLETAYAIHATSNHNMIGAIEEITVNEGLNPRDSLIVTGGGATGCHIAGMAEALGLQRFMVPRLSAGLSAQGGLVSDIRWQVSASAYTDSENFKLRKVAQTLEELAERCRNFLDRAGVDRPARALEASFMGRYQFQAWEIEVPFEIGPGTQLSQSDVPRLTARFMKCTGAFMASATTTIWWSL